MPLGIPRLFGMIHGYWIWGIKIVELNKLTFIKTRLQVLGYLREIIPYSEMHNYFYILVLFHPSTP